MTTFYDQNDWRLHLPEDIDQDIRKDATLCLLILNYAYYYDAIKSLSVKQIAIKLNIPLEDCKIIWPRVIAIFQDAKKKRFSMAHEKSKIVISHFNKTVKTTYDLNDIRIVDLIQKRSNEGAITDDFIRVIDNMYEVWSDDPKMARYLTPFTLFGMKFFDYLKIPKSRQNHMKEYFELQKQQRATMLQEALNAVNKTNL